VRGWWWWRRRCRNLVSIDRDMIPNIYRCCRRRALPVGIIHLSMTSKSMSFVLVVSGLSPSWALL
jgi:hypothetical protein